MEKEMTNALMSDIHKRDQELRSRMFETMMEAFFKRWAPADKYDATRFHSELSMIVRQVYTDAQAPLLTQITQLISVMPMYPLNSIKPPESK